MFIGHLPGGVIVTHYFLRIIPARFFSSQGSMSMRYFNGCSLVFFAGLLGSIFPDFDLIYFYLIDERQHNHHDYITHQPFAYLIALVLMMMLCIVLKKKHLMLAVVIFSLNVFIHLLLDTFAGGISWLYPLNDYKIYFFTVPTEYDWWPINFVMHWTFLFEITICLWFGYLNFYNKINYAGVK